MDRETILLTPGNLIKVTGISKKRLDQQLQRNGADPLAAPKSAALPISPSEAGRHPRYTYADALIVACVVQMTRCGVGIREASQLVKYAHLSSFFAWPQHDEGDMWFASWSAEIPRDDPETLEKPKDRDPVCVFGSLRNVIGRLPGNRMSLVSVNVSEVARSVDARLREIGIDRVGTQLMPRENLL